MTALRPYALLLAAALALATEGLFQPDLLDKFTLGQIGSSVANALVRNLIIVASMLVVLRWIRRRDFSNPILLTLTILGSMLATSIVCNFLFGLWMFGPEITVWSPWVWAQSLSFGAIGSTLALVDTLRIHHLRALAAQRELAVTEDVMLGQLQLAQAQLLEAQIEPHFLFNTIANLRRAWRTDTAVGARMHDNLLRYLKAAVPQMRSEHGILGEEIDLAIAYLELFEVRMGSRLRFEIEAATQTRSQPFPKMMLVTLVENAIKHGLMPSLNGGCVRIETETSGDELRVRVLDDGVGFGNANTGDTGIGLANIRARLQTQFDRGARLTIAERAGRGVCAQITIPLQCDVPAARARSVDDSRGQRDVKNEDAVPADAPSRVIRMPANTPGHAPSSLVAGGRHVAVRALAIWTVFVLGSAWRVLLILPPMSLLDTLLALFQTQMDGIPLALIIAIQLEIIERVAERSIWLSRAVLLAGLLICALISQFPLEVLLWADPISIRTGLAASEADLKAYLLYQFSIQAIFATLYMLIRGRSDESSRRVQMMRSQLLQVRRRMRALRDTASAARLDPQVLFNCLTRSRREYAMSSDGAEHRLDGLIGFLRATLGATEAAGSTVKREIDLLRYYADAAMETSAFAVSEEPAADVARIELAHGLLLPLLQAWTHDPRQPDASKTILTDRFDFAVWVNRSQPPTLFLRLRGPTRPIDAAIDGCRDHLADLYGPEGRLLVSAGPARLEVLLTLSFEGND